MRIPLYENDGITKYLENLAVSKFLKKSENEIVRNDIIDYCNKSKLKASRYQRMRAALKAIDRCGDSIDLDDFENFREMVNYYFG